MLAVFGASCIGCTDWQLQAQAESSAEYIGSESFGRAESGHILRGLKAMKATVGFRAILLLGVCCCAAAVPLTGPSGVATTTPMEWSDCGRDVVDRDSFRSSQPNKFNSMHPRVTRYPRNNPAKNCLIQ